MNFSSSARRVAALSAAGLAASVFAAVPASAESGVLNYNCSIPILGAKTFTLVMDTDAPATLVPGTASPVLNAAAKVTVPADVADSMRSVLGAKSIDGSATSKTTLDAVAQSSALTIPATPVPDSGAMTLAAAGPMYAVTAGVEGTTHTIAAGDFTATMNLKKANGSDAGSFEIPCVAAAGQNMVVDTIKASAGTTTPTPPPAPVKVDSTTTATVKYAKKAQKATVKVSVKGSDGTPGTGKVKVKVKIGKKTKVVNATLNGAGKAKAMFKKVAGKGKYKFAVSYAGAANQNASKAKVVLKLK